MADFTEQVERHAAAHGLDPALVYGIMMKESGGNPLACRYEKAYKWLYKPEVVKPAACSVDTEVMLQKTSFGLMQVMGAVFREQGFRGWLTALVGDVDAQLDAGCRHLADKVRKYGLEDGISAYNAGLPTPLNKKSYVQPVLAFARDYRAKRGG